jgi:hypothetical protein
MKGCVNTWKYSIRYNDEIDVGPMGQIMTNVMCRHAVSIDAQMNSVECTTLQMIQ